MINNILEAKTTKLFNHDASRHAACLSVLTKSPSLGDAGFMIGDDCPTMEVVDDQIYLCLRGETLPHAIIEVGQMIISADDKMGSDCIDAMLHELSYGRFAAPTVEAAKVTNLFSGLWDKFNRTYGTKPYNSAWGNGTGYFNVNCLPQNRGYDCFAFVDDKGRKGLVLWDCYSASRVIVFQRYSDNGLIAYCHRSGCRQGVSGSGAVHTTPSIVMLMNDVNRLASLNDH